MLFNSYLFILGFLPFVVLGFVVFSRFGSAKGAQGWLLVCSLFFYGWWNYLYLSLIIGSVVFNFLIAQAIHGADRARKQWLIVGVIVNLGLLGYYKYIDFFISVVNDISGGNLLLTGVALPLAISFFTFQQIAFLVDEYRDRLDGVRPKFIEYALFVTFFPQLIAGPITRCHNIVSQLRDHRYFRFSYNNLSIGLSIFIFGLFKKVVIADQFSTWVTPVFDAVDSGIQISAIDAWIGMFCYSFQLYFDFSGYSDMAIGLARIFGIRLPANFWSPYKAASIIEFWRRWHITLSNFLRDYLYIALGGNRCKPMRVWANIFITMLLGGLWHGAGWTFIIWGALHGIFIVINHLWRRSSWTCPPRLKPLSALTSILFTFLTISMLWVFFRSASLEGAWSYLGSLAMGFGHGFENIFSKHEISSSVRWIIGGCIVIWLMPNTLQIFHRIRPAKQPNVKPMTHSRIMSFLSFRPNAIWAGIIIVMFIYCLKSMLRTSEFLYFQF